MLASKLYFYTIGYIVAEWFFFCGIPCRIILYGIIILNVTYPCQLDAFHELCVNSNPNKSKILKKNFTLN